LNRILNRRDFLASSAASLAVPFGQQRASATQVAQATASLKSYGDLKRLIVGSATENAELTNTQYASLLSSDVGMLTATWELNWRVLEPTQGAFNFSAPDALLSFCSRNGMKFRGGSLAWYQLYPDWLNRVAAGAPARRVLTQYIRAVVGHFAGRMHSWDVVNEPIFTEDGRPDGLRNNIWVRLLGADYIPTAFQLAHEADRNAILVLNEYGFWYTHPYHVIRRRALLSLLESLVNHGTPINALGIQSHLEPNGPWGPLDISGFGQFLRDVSSLGLKIMITEFDVADKSLPADIATRDQMVADAATEYLDLVLAQRAVISLSTWGSSDRYTWLSWANPRSDGLPVRPLPYDTNLQKKPLRDAIVASINKVPSR
jgi:endo-1,4-beta-xylanase